MGWTLWDLPSEGWMDSEPLPGSAPAASAHSMDCASQISGWMISLQRTRSSVQGLGLGCWKGWEGSGVQDRPRGLSRSSLEGLSLVRGTVPWAPPCPLGSPCFVKGARAAAGPHSPLKERP